nr:putative ribonuclease H-like domain-containing protein [Tanacetum cinerariifolium]
MDSLSPQEVILNGDSPVPTRIVKGILQPVAPTTAEQKLAKKNELKARGTLLMSLLDKHQLKFNSYKDAKTLMEAIEKRFGGNTKTKKKLVSQLEIHGVSLSHEYVKLKFLCSLPSEWKTHTLIWRNKADLKEQNLDDLFKISVAASISAVCAKMPVYSLFNVDSLSNTGRNLGATGPTSMGFDMSIVECYNCHKKGHFARECRSPKDSRRYGAAKPQSRTVPVETSTSNALVSQCDGVGSYYWSYQAKEEPANYALIAFSSSSSSSDNEVFTCAVFDCDDYLSLESDCESWPPTSLYDRFQPSDGYHVIPPPYTGTFMPPKLDLVFNTTPTAVETNHPTFTFSEQVKSPRHSVKHVETSIPAATPKPASPKSDSSGKRRNRKACFVCKSVDHLIKDYDYHAKRMAQPTPRNHAHRGNHKQYAPLTHTNPHKHIVPAAVLTQSKPVSITAVRPVSTDVPKIKVTRPRHAHSIITKSKSPIRTPSIGFMRPFGCLVTILNTIDSLGKIKRKVDKGFLVGYSVNSKAFRIFNSRTCIVQESLHVNFLENKPNVAGSGPTWLFDIDSLTRTMNYQPVTAGNQTNHSNNDGDAAFDGKEHDFDANKPESEVSVSPSSKLEDITYSDDEDDVGAEADFNNLKTSITVSSIPTTRVYKDHPVSQIIGDLSLTTQTRSMTRVVQDQGGHLQMFNDDFHTWFEDPDHPDKAYKVVKTLYSLHQAPRAWYETLVNYLLENGFQRGKIDQTLFIKRQKGDILPVQIYVDDIIFGATNKDLCKSFKKLMKDKFQMSSMGELTFFLGLQVKQKKDGIFISQDKYIAKILRKFGLTEGKSASTLIDTKKPLLEDPNGEDVDVHTCRLISWQCTKKIVVATSSTEAKYVATASCCAQVLWIQNQLLDYGDSPLLGVNTPRSDEDMLELMELTVFLLPKVKKVGIGVNAVDLKVPTIRHMLLLLVQKLLLFSLTNWCCSLSVVSEGFNQIIDFLNESSIKYALTVNPNIYVSCIKQFWTIITVKQVNDVARLQALVDKKKVVITEATIRDALHLDNAEGVDCLPNEEIFIKLARMGYEKPSTKLTFYKAFFSIQWKCSFNPYHQICFTCSDPEEIAEEGDADEHVEEVNTGDAAHGDNSATHAEVPTVQPPSSPPQPQQAADFPISLLQEAIDACAALTRRVMHLEYDKVAQALEITKIETSDDTVMDDESNQGRMIAEIDHDDVVVLKYDKEEDKDVANDVKDVKKAKEDETEPAEVQEVVDVVTTAKLFTEVVTAASETVNATSAIIPTAETQVPAATLTAAFTVLAATLTAALTAAPARVAAAPSRRRKIMIIKDPEEESTTSTIIPAETKSKDKGKEILVEEPKPLKKKQQIKQDEQFSKKLHAELNKDIIGMKLLIM